MNALWRKFFLKKVVKDERGGMLILSLLISSLFITFSAGYLGLLVVEARSTEKMHRSNLALNVAESGVEEAIWEIKYNNGLFAAADGWTGTDPKVKTASLTTSSGQSLGSYTVTVSDPTGTAPIIESVGSALYQTSTAAEARTVEVVLDVESSATYTRAAFGDQEIHMDSNACTDSFDSRDGPYNAQTNRGTDGDVGTNATASGKIHMDSNADIYGDAQVGVGGNPATVISLDSNATISGTSTALTDAVTIPSITAPTGLISRGSLSYDDNDDHAISASGEYTSFTVDGNSSITISGDTTIYVSGDFSMDSNSDLYIASGADVDLYVGGSVLVTSNATINNLTQDPSKLKIYGTDALIDDGSDAGIRLQSNTDIYATVHAKNSTVYLDSNAEVFGAVMSKKVTIQSNSCVHYDIALGDAGSSGSSAAIATWQEK